MLREVQCIFQNPYTSLNPRKTITQTLEEPIHTSLIPGEPGVEPPSRLSSKMYASGQALSISIPTRCRVVSVNELPWRAHWW
jgi:ABC-type dipeptide/oligopeptide/nickel transport system ATPase subunit